MAKVRFLRSAVLVSTGQTVGFNDELDIKDEVLVQKMVKSGLVDVLEEPKPEPKPVKKAPKRAKKEVDLDA
jgi:hypothetical protein